MRINKFMLAASAATFSLFSCINNDYDLSDIDTTVGVNVNVTIPVQMDEITLHSVLDLEEGSQIKEFNGEYAVIEDGTFESDKINIPSFVIKKPVVDPINDKIHSNLKPELIEGIIETIRPDDVVYEFDLSTTDSTDVHFETDDVDESIVDIDKIDFCTKTGDFVELKLSLHFAGLELFAKDFKIEGLEIQLPKGLKVVNLKNGADYNMTTGILEYPMEASNGNTEEVILNLAGIDNTEGVISLVKDEITGKQEFSFTSKCRVYKGFVRVYGENLRDDIDHGLLETLQTIDYTCNINFNSDIEVEDFSGKIQYELEGIDVDPVSMKDIPDVLNQTGTNIALTNPQIYIQLNNPLYEDYKVYATTGLELVPHHENESGAKVFPSSEIKVDAPMNQFCLSPMDPKKYYNSVGAGDDLIQINFSEAEWASYANLGNILEGEQLPQSIDINVVDPKIPVQTVTNFRLGQDIDPVVGTYVFYAPLALTDDSHIAYTDTIDGWNDEDIDALTIDELTVNALVKSDVPLALNLEAYPIDKDGKKIDNVKGEAIVPANAVNEPLVVNIKGNIKHLDGIILKAVVNVAEENTESLKPGQHIGLSELKVKVSGNYIKEL
ncbi:MAG: hypothetical protein NC206_04975 [Bacteroides sp.]|nr:hypothetical protein [Roseburia sp.]MCM1346418.1 hypothetical protein [Bacteroides sp.]MCM1420986.1 hypothetical protein [Bacteroides sp.]